MKLLIIITIFILIDFSYPQNIAVFGTCPLQTGNIWAYDNFTGNYPISKIIDSSITYDDSLNYHIIHSEDLGQTYDTYVRLRGDNFYVQRISDNYAAPNHEYKYYLKGAQSGDYWAQKEPYGNFDSIYTEVQDTFPINFYGEWVTGKILFLYLDNHQYDFWQIWTDEFGLMQLSDDFGVAYYLYSCIINGIAHGDTTVLGVEEIENDVNDFVLYQNYPNPFNPATTINYQIPKTGFVTLKVYDILGKEIATLVNEQKTQGRYSVKFDASSAAGGLASGVYFYQLRAGDFIQTKKMILLK